MGTYRRAFQRIASLSVLIGGPYVAYLAAERFDPGASLIGPFLLASPLFAVMTAATVFSFGSRRPHDGDPLSDEDSRTATELAKKAGFKSMAVYVCDDPESKNPVVGIQDNLLVNLQFWKDMNPAQKEFALATKIAQLAQYKDSAATKSLAWTAWVTLGGFCSALNPWLVIPLHVGSAVTFALFIKREVVLSEFKLDAAALALTGDLKGAESFLRWEEKRLGKVGFVTYDQRIEALRSLRV